MFDQAKGIIGTFISVAVVGLFFWILGSAVGHVHGLPAVGAGVRIAINGIGQMLSGL